MTQRSDIPLPNGSLNGRLDGWKEIAAHLGRGVRTAQRWERELGLPVRRLGTGGAEVVYALRDEVDAWLLKQSRLPTAQPQDEVETARAAERHGFGVWAGPAGLILLLGLLGGSMLLRSPRPAQSSPSAEPAELEVVGNHLNVRGVNHELAVVALVRGAAEGLRSDGGIWQGEPDTDVGHRGPPRDRPQRRAVGPQLRSGPAAVLVRPCWQSGPDASDRCRRVVRKPAVHEYQVLSPLHEGGSIRAPRVLDCGARTGRQLPSGAAGPRRVGSGAQRVPGARASSARWRLSG